MKKLSPFIVFLFLFSHSLLFADLLENIFGSYKNTINTTGKIKENTYIPPDKDFKFIVPSLLSPGYKITDNIDSKLTQGYVTFLDDIGQLYRIDFWDNRFNKTQSERLAELDNDILKTFQKYSQNVSIIKKEKIGNDIYFVFYNFPKASSVLVNNERIDATRGVLFFAQENKIIVLSQQFLSTVQYFNNYDHVKQSLLDLKKNNFSFTLRYDANITDSTEQLKIGYSYLTQNSFTKARYWIEKSASQNHPTSQWLMGLMLIKADGVEQDYKSAKSWLEKSSDNGNIDATYDLAAMYNNGEGLQKDTKKAKELFLKCAKKGYPQAIKELVKIFNQEDNSKEVEYWKSQLK